ncbi:MAG: glycoside hydrolase family 3 protein [Puniceicoccaceae bacterium]
MTDPKDWTLREKAGALFSQGFAGIAKHQLALDKIHRWHASGLRVSPQFKRFMGYRDPKTGAYISSTAGDLEIDLEKQPLLHYRPDQVPVSPATATDYQALLRDMYEENGDKNAILPLHFCFDQEGGESADFPYSGTALFPQPMGIAAAGGPEKAYEVALALGTMMRAIGLTWVHSPVRDINTEPRSPEVLTRAYGQDAETVAEYAIAACRGFKEAGVIATGKHFPGRGHSDVDAHFEVPVIDVDEETLWNRELLPYRRLIEQDLLPSIMIAHSIYPAIDPDHVATASKKVITGLLRERMGFDGVITTDSITMGGMMNRYGLEESCVLALEAGCDLILQKQEEPAEDLDKCLEAVVKAIESGRIPETEVDRKIERQIKLKKAYKLDNFHWHPDPDKVIRRPEFQALSTNLASKALRIARYDGHSLPLSRDSKRILVVEQLTHYRPNDIHAHSGILWKSMLEYNRSLSYYEADTNYNETDRDKLLKLIDSFDTIVLTLYFSRGSQPGTRWIEPLLEREDKTFIVVTNQPFEWIAPKNAKNILLTYSSAAPSARAAAAALFGDPEAIQSTQLVTTN